MKEFYRKNEHILNRYIYPLILLLYPLIKLNQGIDVSDSTYSLGNYLFFDRMQGMWVISTYLSNIVGSLLVHLPGGDSLLMMNLYTGLIVSILALLCYYLLKKEYTPVIVFWGELLAISFCWIPTGILYNYVTYLLFTAGALLIYFGVTREKTWYLFLAGIMLGANVMVRFPNLTQAALILVVWYGCFLYGKIKLIIKQTGICLAGYFAGFLVPFLAVSFQYGFGAYGEMMTSLMSIQQTDESYSALSMVTSVTDAYSRSFRWIAVILLGMFLGLTMFHVAKGRFETLKKMIYLAGIALMLRFFWGRGMFSFRYYEDFSSMFEWGMVFLYLAVIACIVTIWNRRYTKHEKMMAAIVLVILVITPLGSNNYTYQNLNNLFVAAPFVLFFICKSIGMLQEQTAHGKYSGSSFPVIAMLVTLLFMITLQSIGFHGQFVFRDGMGGEKRDTKMTDAGSLNSMYTNRENAAALKGLISYCEEHTLIGQEAVFYGDAPGLSYILHMPFAISTSWPDLDSYPRAYFEEELQNLQTEVFIVKNTEPATRTAAGKQEYLQQYLADRQYQAVYDNDVYTVYQMIK